MQASKQAHLDGEATRVMGPLDCNDVAISLSVGRMLMQTRAVNTSSFRNEKATLNDRFIADGRRKKWRSICVRVFRSTLVEGTLEWVL